MESRRAAIRSVARESAVRCARQFWDVLQRSNPNLLIVDVEMPNFNGIELCQILRNDPQYSQLPVIFLSARRDPQTIQQAFLASADDYLTKPMHVTDLKTHLLNRLRG